MLSSGKALEFDGATLEWLSRSYKADEVYILDAAYRPGGVSVKIFAPSGRGGIEQTVSVDGGNDETTLEAAVKKVKGVISERIKRYNLEEDRRTYEMLVLYEYPSVGDWLRQAGFSSAWNMPAGLIVWNRYWAAAGCNCSRMTVFM